MDPNLLPLGIIGLIVVALFVFFYFVPLGLWITAFFSGVKISIFSDLVGMRLRKVPPGPIVKASITATKAGLNIGVAQLEAHFLAGGNVQKVVMALISADKANLGLSFERAAA
ncbi:MAG: flotillin-like FloA family protein, partial [Balneolales bacterium]